MSFAPEPAPGPGEPDRLGRDGVEAGDRGTDVPLLVSALLAGELAGAAATRGRLVGVEWPDGFPGPRFGAPDAVLVGAIVKPARGLGPAELAATAAALARGGADLVNDDELLGDVAWCPLEERVRAVVDVLPEGVLYAPNVTGASESLLRRAERAVALGASALMVNAFAQGLDSLRLLRERDFGVPLFAHRVGAAFRAQGGEGGVDGAVVAELARLLGADFVQVGSFTETDHDGPESVRAQVAACHRPLAGARPAIAVLGGGTPENAAEQVGRSGASAGVMVLLGPAAYAHPGGVEQGVRAAVEAVAA